ncbi:erythromycin esterase family protein [Streptomyces sp. NPDC050610]|uniref:erythromycin esterase family protein n=1 Tax=Streptomyces sp. NPDC050610 TaxID=3157097 RepID=UPI003423F184
MTATRRMTSDRRQRRIRHRPALLVALLLCLGATTLAQPAAQARQRADEPVRAGGPIRGGDPVRAGDPARGGDPVRAGAGAPVRAAGAGGSVRARAEDPVPALTRAAHSLRTTEPAGGTRDLRAFGRMVGDAKVVGVGEATHGSHEFIADKDRLFRYLVERKGFTTFALEVDWSAGLRINDYVLHGKGNARQIMKEEFQNSYRFWNNQEYLDLIEWMRAYNTHHARKVQFMGDDVGYAGPELFDRVTDYAARHAPALLPRLTALYRGQRPTPGSSVDSWMAGYMRKPLAERRDLAARAGQALDLLRRQRPGADRSEFAWTVRHARAISQVASLYAYDLYTAAGNSAAMRFRDEAMAANTAWWQRRTGHKMLLSAHNTHVAYVSDDPANYPKVQGAFLRDRLGDDYLSARLTFDAGSFNATAASGTGTAVYTVGPAERGSNEYTLDQVPFRDYFLDMRTAPAAARAWLGEARPTRNIGTAYPDTPRMTALGSSCDLLIHLHRVTASRLFDDRRR